MDGMTGYEVRVAELQELRVLGALFESSRAPVPIRTPKSCD
jgi:hypothetical protein